MSHEKRHHHFSTYIHIARSPAGAWNRKLGHYNRRPGFVLRLVGLALPGEVFILLVSGDTIIDPIWRLEAVILEVTK